MEMSTWDNQGQSHVSLLYSCLLKPAQLPCIVEHLSALIILAKPSFVQKYSSSHIIACPLDSAATNEVEYKLFWKHLRIPCEICLLIIFRVNEITCS